LQALLFRPHARSAVFYLATRSEWFWRRMFERTR
jgi:hypothetical protein